MCMGAPSMPAPPPFVPPPAPLVPPPSSASAEVVKQSAPSAAAPKKARTNPLRTDSGAVDSVTTGLNIPQ